MLMLHVNCLECQLLQVLEQIGEDSDSTTTLRAVLSQVNMKRHARLAFGDSAQHYRKFDKYYYD